MNHACTSAALSPSRLALAALTCLLACFPALRVQAAEASPVFPLMAWDDVYETNTLAAMRDCGITCVAFVRPDMLDACRDHQLQAIVFDESVAGTNWSRPYDGELARRNLPALIKQVGSHPAVLGYHLKDEPGAHEFPELAKAVAAVKELAPGKWPYINLFPGDGAPYDKYLQDFVAICKPTALSYDRYVLVGEKDFLPVFWVNLSQARAVACQHRLPLWNIVLTSPHWGYREITEGDIRLQNWGSLAYGVSGLAFYKFCSKSLNLLDAPDLGNFHNGPLDQFGEKTQTWNWLRNCNRQIQAIAPVYLKLRSDDVYHLGTIPDRNHGPTETNLVKSLPQGDVVVGDFTHEDGTRFALVVNKSLKSPVACVPEFRKPPAAIKYVCPVTGRLKPFPLPYYWLAPGQGVLLQVL